MVNLLWRASSSKALLLGWGEEMFWNGSGSFEARGGAWCPVGGIHWWGTGGPGIQKNQPSKLIFSTLAERSPVLELLILVARQGLEVVASSRTRRSTSSRGLASLLLCLHQPLSSRCQRVADGGLPLLKPLLQAAPRSVLSYPRDSPSWSWKDLVSWFTLLLQRGRSPDMFHWVRKSDNGVLAQILPTVGGGNQCNRSVWFGVDNENNLLHTALVHLLFCLLPWCWRKKRRPFSSSDI